VPISNLVSSAAVAVVVIIAFTLTTFFDFCCRVFTVSTQNIEQINAWESKNLKIKVSIF